MKTDDRVVAANVGLQALEASVARLRAAYPQFRARVQQDLGALLAPFKSESEGGQREDQEPHRG